MGFQKGHSGFKPKGVPNKKTTAIVERVEFVLGLLNETIEDDIRELEPRERAKMWENLQEYIRPKLARTELSGEVEIQQSNPAAIINFNGNAIEIL
jgi:hypothetical protein